MKKIFFTIITFAFMLSCSDDKVNNEPDEGTLVINGTEEVLSFEASGKIISFETSDDINERLLSIKDIEGEWCTAKLNDDGKTFEVTVSENKTSKERTAIVQLRVGKLSDQILIKQLANEFIINEDILLKVSGGEASSQEIVNEKTGFEKSYDGDPSTVWHSKWSDVGTFPITAIYNLENADVLDYIVYYPRTIGSNGRLGKIEIWISTETEPEFKKLMDYDCKQEATSKRIELAKPVEKPKSVKFVINSGLGGYASCAEMGFYKKAEKTATKYIDIPVSSTGYTEPDEYKNNVSQIMKLAYSATDKPLGKIYFKFTDSGKAQLHLKVRNTTANKKMKITLGEFQSEVDLPITSDYEWINFLMQDFKPTNDFLCLTLENLSEGNIEIESLRVVGNISEKVAYNTNPTNRRNAVSVHLGYQTENIKDIEWFYNEVTIPKGFDKPYHSFYMVNGWGKGYSGIQVRDKSGNNSKRWLIFSCWNTNESGDENYFAKVEKTGANVKVESFGGEGTGAKTYLELDWVTDKTYQFLLRAKVVGTSVYYSLFWKAKEDNDWKFQATIHSPHNPNYLSGLHSFVENYIGQDGHLQRKANYANQWVKNSAGWTQLTRARFTSDENIKYRTDVGAAASKNSFYLWNGGYIASENLPGVTLTRTSSENTIPVSDAELTKLIEISNVE